MTKNRFELQGSRAAFSIPRYLEVCVCQGSNCVGRTTSSIHGYLEASAAADACVCESHHLLNSRAPRRHLRQPLARSRKSSKIPQKNHRNSPSTWLEFATFFRTPAPGIDKKRCGLWTRSGLHLMVKSRSFCSTSRVNPLYHSTYPNGCTDQSRQQRKN